MYSFAAQDKAFLRRFAVAILFSAALAGCSFRPDYVRPDIPVPVTYARTEARDSPVTSLHWEEFFQDPQLQFLIKEALANNRDIRIATARIEEARAAYRIQGSLLYPQIDAVGTATRAHTPADLSYTGNAITSTQIYSQLSAGWEIDFWGRLQNLREAAREQYLATQEAWRAVATSLVAQLANSYLLDRELEERITLAQHTTSSREESLRIIRRRYEVGSGSKLDMMQAEMLYAQAQTALLALEQEREINLNTLALLVGKPIKIIPGTLQSTEEAIDHPLPPGLPSDLLVNRPDIIAAEHQLKAANANIGAARAAFFPNISLTGAFGTASAELDGLFAGGSHAWSFTPVISLPLFHASRNAANFDVAKARRNIAVAEYERTIQQAFQDVANALVQRRQLSAQIASMRDMLVALNERARLARLRFDNGRSAYLEVLDAERDLFQTEQTLVQLRRAYLASGVALYSALGGGFPIKSSNEPKLTAPEVQ